MKFEKLDIEAICQSGSASNMLAAAGTTIETKVGPFWRKDGTDEALPEVQTSSW